MRYLRLFEAFESDVVSKTTKYIKKRLGKNESEKFILYLNKIQEKLDFPLSKISDNDIEYLPVKKALSIKNHEEVKNRSGIYCIKFWFSLDHGFIGFTSVSNDRYDINSTLNDYHINKLKEDGIETGILTMVDRTAQEYSKLKHGDDVIAVLDDDDSDTKRLTKGKIFKDGDNLYIIHNNRYSSGGYPDYQYVSRDEAGNWRDWGNDSWSIGTPNNINSDHKCLHKYTPSDSELKVETIEKEEDNRTFNLPTNSKIKPGRWSNYRDDDWSMNVYYDNVEKFGWEKLEIADFAIILYLDNILQTKLSDIRNSRVDLKKGATKLLSDDQIRNANIDRYMKAIIGRMGISETEVDFKNLQKLISASLCGDYSLFSIKLGKPKISNIDNMLEDLSNLLGNYNEYKRSNNERSLSYLSTSYKRVISRYQSMKSDNKSYYKNYNNNYTELMKLLEDNELDNSIKSFFVKYKEIGSHINKYISNTQVNTLEDYAMLYTKILSIKNLLNNYIFSLDDKITSTISDFSYRDGEVDYHIRQLRYVEMDEYFNKLNKIEEYVKSILN